MVSRVSTLTFQQTTLRDSTRLQNDIFGTQVQISSGLKARDYTGLNGDVEQFTTLENKLAKSEQYLKNNKQIKARLDATSNALSQVIDVSNSLKNLIVQRRNGAAGSSMAFDQQLDGLFRSLAGQLNSNYDGRYLFSGASTDQKAVDDKNFPSLHTTGIPDTGYYTGGNQDMQVRVQDNYEITYTVRGDEQGFQDIFAALATAREGGSSNSDALLQKAYELVQGGIDKVINVQASVNANGTLIEQANDQLTNLTTYWKIVRDELVSTDLVTASSKLAVDQGILQASFQAFAKINSLQLSDYLR